MEPWSTLLFRFLQSLSSLFAFVDAEKQRSLWCGVSCPLSSGRRLDRKLRVAVDGDARQVVPDDLVHVIEVHLVQLLRLLLDADGEGLGGGVRLVSGRFFGLWGQWGGARHGESCCSVSGGTKRRLRAVVWRGGLGQRGQRGRGEASRRLLNDGHMRDSERLLLGQRDGAGRSRGR